MKETVLDVLVYLFENYFHGAPDTVHDRDSLQGELIEAGFDHIQIGKAFDWLLELQTDRVTQLPAPATGPIRVYAREELDRLDAQCIGFLMRLEAHGVLDAESRERVLERAWALEQGQIDLEDLKWVVLLVLFNEPGREAEFAWMETQLLGQQLRAN
jgi:Smg protein